MAQPSGLTLANSEPQSLRLQIRGPKACAAPPTAPGGGQGGPPGSRPLPALWPPQGRSEMSRGVPVSRWRAAWGHVGPGTSPAAACFTLPHLREGRAVHLDNRPGPWPASPAGRHLCTTSSLDQAPVGSRPWQGCWASWPQPPGGQGRSELPGRVPRDAGVPGAAASSVWPALCLPDRALWAQLSGPACLHFCLSEFGAVCESGSCLAAPGLSGSTFLSLCLLGVFGPVSAWPLAHSAGWA